MLHINRESRARNRAFTELQEATVSSLRHKEVAASLGAHSLTLIGLVEDAVPVSLKDGSLSISKRYRDGTAPLILVLLKDEHKRTIDISPAANRYLPDLSPHSTKTVSLESYDPTLPSKHHGGFYSFYVSSEPSSVLSGDFIRISPRTEGPIIINAGRERHTTLAHEIDHLSYVREGNAISPRSILEEVTAMELRAHRLSYLIHSSEGRIVDIDFEDIKQAHLAGIHPQSTGEALFHRVRDTYGSNREEFGGHYTHAVRELSGNNDFMHPTMFEQYLMTISGLVPTAEDQASLHQ